MQLCTGVRNSPRKLHQQGDFPPRSTSKSRQQLGVGAEIRGTATPVKVQEQMHVWVLAVLICAATKGWAQNATSWQDGTLTLDSLQWNLQNLNGTISTNAGSLPVYALQALVANGVVKHGDPLYRCKFGRLFCSYIGISLHKSMSHSCHCKD